MRHRPSFFNKRFHPLKTFFFLTMAALFLAVAGGLVMFLWNYTLPHLFDVRPITYWQALALFLLARMLFGGFGRHKFRHKKDKWRNQWKEKWMDMDESDRAQFKSKWKEYCDRAKKE